LRPAERDLVYEACDDHLRRIVTILEPEWLIGIGAFAENQARRVFSNPKARSDLKIGRVLHPSPASPKANRGWAREAKKELRALVHCPNTRTAD
jgi:single-strand selective monofunctional uracil DNA glycosylase